MMLYICFTIIWGWKLGISHKLLIVKTQRELYYSPHFCIRSLKSSVTERFKEKSSKTHFFYSIKKSIPELDNRIYV